MNLFRFLKGKWLFLVASLFTALFCGVLLTGLGADLYAAFFVSGVFVAGLFAALLLEYLQKRRFYQELEQNLQAIDRKYLLAETLEEPDFPEGQLCWRALCEAGRSMNDEIAACRRAEEEYREYVEVWVHEVKTPIASALLLAENHPGEVSGAMIRELRRIDALVEQSMFYARSRQVEKDYLLRRVADTPLLGICLGMQFLMRRSFEGGEHAGLGLCAGDVVRFTQGKVPAIGWNGVTGLRTPLFEGLPEGSEFYFVHSYYAPVGAYTIGRAEYGAEYSAAVWDGRNAYGVQFHPEKSGETGLRLLRNFLHL